MAFYSDPLVSICIPAYNSGKYIGETIDSLLNQSYQNLEIIVVDDGSTDGTCNVLKRIQDQRLIYVTQENKGASAARNAAFRLSSGSFIKFMDADDLLNPACIERQVAKLLGKEGSLASAKWGRFYKDDRSDFRLSPENVWKDLPGIDWLIESLLPTGANMMQPGIFLAPRDIVEKAGPWNENLSLIDDFEYMIRLISQCEEVLFCENAVLMYRSGNLQTLSGQTSPRHMVSAFNSLQLGVKRILEARNDARSRQACANTYKRWSYTFYPHHKVLYYQLEQEIEKLGGSDVPMPGSRLFRMLANYLGWKKAKRLKILLGRTTY